MLSPELDLDCPVPVVMIQFPLLTAEQIIQHRDGFHVVRYGGRIQRRRLPLLPMGRFPLENSADDSDENNVVHHAKEQHEVNEFDAEVVFVRSEYFEGAVAEEEEHEREESESQQLVLDDFKEVAVNYLLELVLDVFN